MNHVSVIQLRIKLITSGAAMPLIATRNFPRADSTSTVHSPATDDGATSSINAAGAVALPLADDGHIYCGTCHIFHDPKVASEDWLKHGWLPADRGLAAAVRQGVADRWAALAAASEEKGAVGKFAAKGTLQLRLPVDDGQLCRRCHGAPP